MKYFFLTSKGMASCLAIFEYRGFVVFRHRIIGRGRKGRSATTKYMASHKEWLCQLIEQHTKPEWGIMVHNLNDDVQHIVRSRVIG